MYHIHLRYAGDNDELYFRDYLNEHPAVAKGYETLKLRLWKQYEHNRDLRRRCNLKIENNILKYYLKNVYFITGTAYAGKSTTVKMLAEKYDIVNSGFFTIVRQDDGNDTREEVCDEIAAHFGLTNSGLAS